MYRGLVASGGILAVFGAFLVFTDLYVPLGVSIFGLAFLVVGVIMFLVGVWRKEPPSIEPEPGMKFCWYCMVQIPVESKECFNCSLPQHDVTA
jgi:membrane-bound ClpP family serine protease